MSEEFVIWKNGRKIIMPTPEEEEAIARGIASDPDAAEVSTEAIRNMRPFSELTQQQRQRERLAQASGNEEPKDEPQQPDKDVRR